MIRIRSWEETDGLYTCTVRQLVIFGRVLWTWRFSWEEPQE